MKEFDKIPVSKVQRATKFIKTGAKIGTNYLRHYGRKLVNPEVSKDELHQDNAEDIYESLSELKGSALKVAQMLSMDKSILPRAYQQKFTLAQYSAPPLSYPLVTSIVQKSLGKKPEDLFDQFTRNAVNAASMGQVHQATKAKKTFAVKVQYPGIADSVKSDLAMVKPIALSMFNLNPADYKEFIQEVESRLLEETDYALELKRSVRLSNLCSHIKGLKFPSYYPELSSKRILTMDWLEGEPLGEAMKKKIPEEVRSKVGQALWDFYHFQIHSIKEVHADPHPGNFILMKHGALGIIDFGCVKVIPEDFYANYFRLLDREVLNNPTQLNEIFYSLKFIYPEDSPKEKAFFTSLFVELVELLSRPFTNDSFDFSDDKYFETLYAYGERLASMKEIRNSQKARGVKDALYINRTYFGLYSILHELRCEVNTNPKIN